MTSPTAHFKSLGAPLRNYRWSWGAERADGSVVMRAWNDEIRQIDGRPFVRLTNKAVYEGTPHPGFRERLKQIESIEQGAKGFLVMCTAVKPTPGKRRIQSFNREELVRIPSLQSFEGDVWAEMGESVSSDV